MSEQPIQPPRPRGHVEPTPEARPAPASPTLRDHLRGPIPGMPAAGPGPDPSRGGAAQNGARAAHEPTPAAGGAPERPRAAPSPNAPIPLFGDQQQGRSGWSFSDLLKPLTAVAVILVVNLLRLVARGMSALSSTFDAKRK